MAPLHDFIRGLPKAELHLHIEGSLEPELMFALARRNGIALPFRSVEEVKAAYAFSNLQDFLDIYYQGAGVLRTEADFHDLALAYFDRVAADGCRHVELFFDPQTHTDRGLPFGVVADGLLAGMAEAARRHGISAQLILCFLRHLDESDAFVTLEQARPWLDRIAAVGVGLGVEEDLGVASAVGGGAAEIGQRQVAEVGLGAQHVGALIVDVEEVLEIAEVIGRAERLDRGEGQGDAVAPGELEHLLGLEAAFDVQVQLSLRKAADEVGKVGHEQGVSVWRAPRQAAVSLAAP